MQALLSPAVRPRTYPAVTAAPSPLLHDYNHHLTHRAPKSLSRLTKQSLPFSQCTFVPSSNFPFGLGLNGGLKKVSLTQTNASSPVSPASGVSQNDDPDKAKLAQVAKRLESTAKYFKRLGSLGFWGQLICTVVSAVILSFSVVITGKITSPPTFYATAGGIAAAFISIFWSFGYIRLSDKLRKTANDPSKAPPRADVVKSLKNGIVLNLLGMGAAILGMQATVGLLVAKALTSSANPYYQGISPGYSPVLALDVFLVQASANTILSHFLGLVFSLELLRSVTLPPSESTPIPRFA